MSRRTGMGIALAALLLGGYFLTVGRRGAVPPPGEDAPRTVDRTVDLGPADGRDLPAQDTGRVRIGDTAPDFSLLAHSGEVLALSDFRGRRNVVLVFYRGHW